MLICVFEPLYECCVFNVYIVIFVSFSFFKTHLCDIHNCHYCYSHLSMPFQAYPHICFLTVSTFGMSFKFSWLLHIDIDVCMNIVLCKGKVMKY